MQRQQSAGTGVMVSCSHWGMFAERNGNAVNNFHGAMQLAQMASQANSINQMYQNIRQYGLNTFYQKNNFGELD